MLLAGAAAPALAQTDLTGDWEIRLTTQTGVTTWQARFEQDGDRLGGEIDLGDNEILDVDGTVDGAKLAFVIVVPDLDGDQPIDFAGEVTGDTMPPASVGTGPATGRVPQVALRHGALGWAPVGAEATVGERGNRRVPRACGSQGDCAEPVVRRETRPRVGNGRQP